jgi:hypothetical protein
MLLQQMPAPTSDLLTRWKDWASIAESIAKVVALIVLAIWTYLLFIRQRQKFPRAKIEHALVQYPLPAGKVLLRLNVSITNIGNVLLQMSKTNIEISQFRPWPKDLMNDLLSGTPIQAHGPKQNPIVWPLVHKREITAPETFKEIEPNETENIYFDFIVEASLQAFFIWTYFENQTKRGRTMGWNTTSTQELQVAQTKEAHGHSPF